jgi:N-carbamoylputrescine amidase
MNTGMNIKSKETVVAAIQMSMSQNIQDNIDRAKMLIHKAAKSGAQIILLPELFTQHYFCKTQNPLFFQQAISLSMWKQSWLRDFSDLAKSLSVVLPISFFEKSGPEFYNSVVVFDTDGSMVSHYRKSHIPDGPGYQEKFYFKPGNTGFTVASTAYGMIGVGICWDQWFPEAARAMALLGAEFLLYPTAIGSEPQMPTYDSSDHWQRVMQGHAAANMIPVIAANRTGTENQEGCEVNFYGKSFITDGTGAIKKSLDMQEEGIICYAFDRDALAEQRSAWGIFRDRRPDLYNRITT